MLFHKAKVTVINVYEPNNKASKYIKQTQLRENRWLLEGDCKFSTKRNLGINGTILYCD